MDRLLIYRLMAASLAFGLAACDSADPVTPLEEPTAALSDGESPGLSVAANGPVYNPETGNYYHGVGAGGITWAEANLAALDLVYEGCYGHLATVTTPQENEFISDLFAPGGRAWLGGLQDPSYGEPDGGWAWITGEPFCYTNWQPGEPNDLIEAISACGGPGMHEDYLNTVGNWAPPADWSQWNDLAEYETCLVAGYLVEIECGSRPVCHTTRSKKHPYNLTWVDDAAPAVHLAHGDRLYGVDGFYCDFDELEIHPCP